MAQELKTLVVLFKTHSSIVRHVKKSLEETQLSVNEFTAMEALWNKGSLSAQGLIDLVLIPNSSLTYVLDTLSKKGLVKREKDPHDRRVQSISLTGRGEDVIREIYEIHYAHMREIFDVLSPEEENELRALLKKLGKHAERKLK